MTAKTFGRRGIDPLILERLPAAVARPATARVATVPIVGEGYETRDDGSDIWARIPFATFALILLFAFGYGLQTRLAVDTAPDGGMGIQSLIADGAVSYDRVFQSGDWWRILLAPLVHASVSHQLGNCFALFFVGLKLEPMLGRAWFLTVFVLSALGGVAGSFIGNPHAIVTVGASGAITGLIGALFVASFHHKAAELADSAAMRRTALKFGIPALLPLFLGVSGHTDYSAHAGGALTGAVIGLVVCALWAGDERRPRLSETIVLVPVLYVAAAVVAGACAYRAFPSEAARTEAARAEEFMPDSVLPKNFNVGDARSRQLAERYPKDPRAHILRGLYFLIAGRAGPAEYEVRQAISIANAGPFEAAVHTVGDPLLAVALKQLGRSSEAKSIAAASCGKGQQAELSDMLQRYGLCKAS